MLALVLAGIEVVAPGTFFIWFGAAALVVGLLALAVAMSWQVELVLFVALSAVAVLAGRRFYGRASKEGDGFANDRLGRQVGRFAVVDRAIEGGLQAMSGSTTPSGGPMGRTCWRVRGSA